VKSLQQIEADETAIRADRTREPAALRQVADDLMTTHHLYLGESPAHGLVRVVLFREARRLRALATREENRRRR
jgi:hypothetical protein